MKVTTKERPILFSGPMVRAILEGRKTQTRRVLEWPLLSESDGSKRRVFTPACFEEVNELLASRSDDPKKRPRCRYGFPGDRLWVRETWAYVLDCDHFNHLHRNEQKAIYKADGDSCPARWRPSIHMPRSKSRITLEVTDVRVELLQEITEEDAIAEGFEPVAAEPWWQGYKDAGPLGLIHQQDRGAEPPDWMIEPKLMSIRDPLAKAAKPQFARLWDALNGPRGFGWDANPWVFVVSFKRLEGQQ